MASSIRWRTIASVPYLHDRDDFAFVAGAEIATGIRVHDIAECLPSSVREKVESVAGWSLAQELQHTKLALVAEYEADSLGSAQVDIAARMERAWLSLWLVGPTALSPRQFVHMEQVGTSWVLRQHLSMPPYIRLSASESKRITPELLVKARPLEETLESFVPLSLFDLVQRVTLLALRQPTWEVRLGVVWMAIEMMLGSESPGETSRAIAQRAAVLLESTQSGRSERVAAVKQLYGHRSKVVHGRVTGSSEPEIMKALVGSERLLRDLLVRLCGDPTALKLMSAKGREKWLESQVLGGST